MAEWTEYTVADVISTVIDYRGKTPKKLGGDWSESGYRALSAKNIKTGKIVQEDSIRYVSGKMYRCWMKEEIQKGDILITSEAPFGQIYYWDSYEKIVLSQRLFAVRVNNTFYPKYIYFYMISSLFQAELDGRATGTTVVGLRQPELLKCKICAPDYQEQKRIADTLWCIEQKINNNEMINNNLLEQASTLFNSAIQKSTSVVYAELGSLAEVKGGKRLPKGINLVTTPNQHPYIRVRDLNNTVFASLSNDYEYVDDETQQSISRYIVSTGDLLISIVGTIGLTAIVDHTLNKANLTENCVKLTNIKNVIPEYLLLFLRSSQGVEAISKGTVGAVQLKLPIKNIQSIAVPLLCDEELRSLNETLSTIFSQISANIVEIKQLADIRDTLLPKLISGELDVSNIDL